MDIPVLILPFSCAVRIDEINIKQKNEIICEFFIIIKLKFQLKAGKVTDYTGVFLSNIWCANIIKDYG